MAVINKVTKLYPESNQTLNDETIQDHLDEMNSAGWNLVSVVDFIGWYRFFWAKVI